MAPVAQVASESAVESAVQTFHRESARLVGVRRAVGGSRRRCTARGTSLACDSDRECDSGPMATRISVILLVDARGWLLLQERDELAPQHANQWGLVGGHVEDGEDFETAAYRELEEETGLAFGPGALSLLFDEELDCSCGTTGHERVYAAHTDLTDDDITLGEGRQIVFCDPEKVFELDLADSARHFLPQLLASDFYRDR